jgi:hypothetical protein
MSRTQPIRFVGENRRKVGVGWHDADPQPKLDG